MLVSALDFNQQDRIRSGNADAFGLVRGKRKALRLRERACGNYAAFCKAFAKGQFFNASIRDRFSYRQIKQGN